MREVLRKSRTGVCALFNILNAQTHTPPRLKLFSWKTVVCDSFWFLTLTWIPWVSDLLGSSLYIFLTLACLYVFRCHLHMWDSSSIEPRTHDYACYEYQCPIMHTAHSRAQDRCWSWPKWLAPALLEPSLNLVLSL